MGLLGSFAGGIGKAIAKEAIHIASAPAAVALDNMRKEKAEDRNQAMMQDDTYPFKLLIKQRPNSVTDKFNVYDENGNVVYQVAGRFFSSTPNLTVCDADGTEIARLQKKIFTFRSPLERYDGENVEFEVTVRDHTLGSLRNKKLGDWSDGLDKRFQEVKDSFAGSRYEYDFLDWEIIDKTTSFGYEIVSKEGIQLAKVGYNLWSYGNCYVIGHSSKEYELFYLLMILAMDALKDDRSKRERISDRIWFGSSDDEENWL